MQDEARAPDRTGDRLGVEAARNAARAEVALSVVVPVYDEKPCLERLWSRLEAVLGGLGGEWEVIFVDDGSTDGGIEVLRGIRRREQRVRLLRMSRNSGQSAALDAGFRAARGEWVATLDADLQNPPEELPRLVEASGEVDLVYGRRATRHDGWVRRMSSRIANGFRNGVTGHRVADTGCSLKLYRRECLARIPRFDGMHRFLPTLFAFHGFRIREIEVRHEPRFGGESKYGIRNRLFRGLLDCLAVRWMRGRSFRYEVDEEEG